MAGYWKYNNKTLTRIQICIGLVDAVHRSKTLGDRLSILTQNLIAMDYFFFIYVSEKYLQFRKKQKHLLRKIFGSPHTSKRIYLLCNCFSNYIYISIRYAHTLKGIGKFVLVSVLKICYKSVTFQTPRQY